WTESVLGFDDAVRDPSNCALHPFVVIVPLLPIVTEFVDRKQTPPFGPSAAIESAEIFHADRFASSRNDVGKGLLFSVERRARTRTAFMGSPDGWVHVIGPDIAWHCVKHVLSRAAQEKSHFPTSTSDDASTVPF